MIQNNLLVYSVSKWKASSATTVGWKGGDTDFLTSWSQSMEEKKVCALMSSIPFGPDPSRFVGFLLKRARRRDWASGLRKVGIPSFALRIWFMVCFLSSPWNGNLPVNISYINTPKLHQSAEKSWPRLLTTSGAIYSTVPQKLNAFSSTPSLHNPKSVTAM